MVVNLVWRSKDLVDTSAAGPIHRFELTLADAAKVPVATRQIVEAFDVLRHV